MFFFLNVSVLYWDKIKKQLTSFWDKVCWFFKNNPKQSSFNKIWCVFINHIYMIYISAKGFANLTFNWADIVKNIRF